jgi:hypothetical protein
MLKSILIIMINNQLDNPFANSRKSNEEFGLLALSHIKYLEAANENETYSDLIGLLKPAYQNYRDWLSKQETSKTTKKGKTMSVNEVLHEVDLFIDDLYEAAYSWKRKKPTVFNSLFPNGKSEYATLNKTNAETVLKRLSDACAANNGLDDTIKARALSLLGSFVSARQEQLGKKGDVKEGSDDGRSLRFLLSKQMYLVFLNLIILNIDDTEKVKNFYDTQFINPRATKKKIDETPVN